MEKYTYQMQKNEIAPPPTCINQYVCLPEDALRIHNHLPNPKYILYLLIYSQANDDTCEAGEGIFKETCAFIW